MSLVHIGSFQVTQRKSNVQRVSSRATTTLPTRSLLLFMLEKFVSIFEIRIDENYFGCEFSDRCLHLKTPEESRRIQQLKRYVSSYHNKDNNPKNHNQNNIR